jgi:hypothetical protein
MDDPMSLRIARYVTRRDFLRRSSGSALALFALAVARPHIAMLRPGSVVSTTEVPLFTCSPVGDCDGCACADFYHCTGTGCDVYLCATGHNCTTYTQAFC